MSRSKYYLFPSSGALRTRFLRYGLLNSLIIYLAFIALLKLAPPLGASTGVVALLAYVAPPQYGLNLMLAQSLVVLVLAISVFLETRAARLSETFANEYRSDFLSHGSKAVMPRTAAGLAFVLVGAWVTSSIFTPENATAFGSIATTLTGAALYFSAFTHLALAAVMQPLWHQTYRKQTHE